MSNYGNNGYSKKVLQSHIELIYGNIRWHKKQCNAIKNDPDLSDIGKLKKLEDLEKKTEADCKRMLTENANRIRKIRVCLELEAGNLRVAKTDKRTHQLRVSNINKALELRGRSITVEELRELVQPITYDISVMESLIAAAASGGRDPLRTKADIKAIFEECYSRRETIKNLSELEKCIRSLWDCFGGIELDFSAASMLLESKLAHFNETLSVYREDVD